MEHWLPVAGYEGRYEVSDAGRVRRLFPKRPPLILKPEIGRRGCHRVGLWEKSVCVRFQLHRLVMGAFVGASDLTVNHKDGNRFNNQLSNLEYMTLRENIQHAFDVLGKKSQKGTTHGRHKLTDAEVLAIRASTAPIADAAAQFGCCIATVSMIRNRRTWRHI